MCHHEIGKSELERLAERDEDVDEYEFEAEVRGERAALEGETARDEEPLAPSADD